MMDCCVACFVPIARLVVVSTGSYYFEEGNENNGGPYAADPVRGCVPTKHDEG